MAVDMRLQPTEAVCRALLYLQPLSHFQIVYAWLQEHLEQIKTGLLDVAPEQLKYFQGRGTLLQDLFAAVQNASEQMGRFDAKRKNITKPNTFGGY